MPSSKVSFADELLALLPEALPNRPEVVDKSARHLDLIVDANRHFNLTRITDAREAAIKHVVDSVIPWRLFSEALHVIDVGSGAGFPGIPLAVALPHVRFTLSESVGKKARFIESAVRTLELTNVEVLGERGEQILRSSSAELITARAVAPIGGFLEVFGASLKSRRRALVYKGPDASSEIAEASAELKKWRCKARVIETYELPDALGARTIVEIVPA